MSVANFIEELERVGIQLSANGDSLHYRAPKGALTPELRAELVGRKPEILAYLRNASKASYTSSSIESVPRDGELPLSFAQEWIWFLARFDPDSPAYTVPMAIRISSALKMTC